MIITKKISVHYRKVLSIIIAIALIIPTVFISTGWSAKDDADKRQKAVVNKLPSDGSLGEEYIGRLEAEGYGRNKINQAEILVERVIYELEEITDTTEEDGIISTDPLISVRQEDLKYIKLSEEIDLKSSVYLIVKLEEAFGSMEKALDEYLYSLQLGINLEKYLENAELYIEEKKQKCTNLNLNEIITISKIEDRMLEKLQALNAKSGNSMNNKNNIGNITDNVGNTGIETHSSESGIADVKPLDPLEDVKKEILSPQAK